MINRATIMGRIGHIENKTVNNNHYTKLSIATNEYWKDKEGQKQEKTIWHNVYGFGKLSEIMAKYAQKGDLVYVEGRIAQNKYKDDAGNEKISPSITATEFKLINTNKTSESPSHQQENNVNVKLSGSRLDDEIPW